jgi:hypothetical protein
LMITTVESSSVELFVEHAWPFRLVGGGVAWLQAAQGVVPWGWELMLGYVDWVIVWEGLSGGDDWVEYSGNWWLLFVSASRLKDYVVWTLCVIISFDIVLQVFWFIWFISFLL